MHLPPGTASFKPRFAFGALAGLMTASDRVSTCPYTFFENRAQNLLQVTDAKNIQLSLEQRGKERFTDSGLFFFFFRFFFFQFFVLETGGQGVADKWPARGGRCGLGGAGTRTDGKPRRRGGAEDHLPARTLPATQATHL